MAYGSRGATGRIIVYVFSDGINRLKSTNSTIYLNMFIVLFHLLHIIVADVIQIHTGNPV